MHMYPYLRHVSVTSFWKRGIVTIARSTRDGTPRVASPTYALRSLDGIINGQRVAAADGRTSAVINPADGAVIARVADLGEAETRAAIAAASEAGHEWAGRTPAARARVLKEWGSNLRARAASLAMLLSAESGKPYAEAVGEVFYAADFFEWFAEEARRPIGDVLASPLPGRRASTMRGPIGVCAALTPWNFPAAMPARKLAAALAAGCTVVLRPAPETPLTALALAECGEDAGLPPGALNVITGVNHDVTAAVLTASPVVRKVSFTGSTRVGRLIAAACAPTLKRVSLELGGHAAFIVFADADIEAAVEGAMAAKFRNAGQTCVCANTFFVHEDVAGAFAAQLVARVQALVVGDGLVGGVTMGPLISHTAVLTATRLVADAVVRGARVITGGGRPTHGGIDAEGTFFAPTVLTGVSQNAACVTDEIFGPIAPIVTFRSEQEAVALANASPAGLAAYFYTRDAGRVIRVSEALRVGMVGVNAGAVSSAMCPFGGVKDSGYGREGAREGLLEYSETKLVMQGGF